MLKNQLRRDLQWLKRQARKDRRITVALLIGVAAFWTRQLSPWDPPEGAEVLLGLSLGLLAASTMTWVSSAYLVTRSMGARKEPVEELRWVSRIRRAKEWACWSVGACAAWHLLQFVTALVMG
ncbi:hypothetical protein [Nonomuraea sp. SYSU D8015]|uniref:hypothetical protein n=1 Tax=Nonomuraea sp. SYSU D8015 TaxID=2593644 RepID=UPI0016605B12|nr:hypothetical protein [Nonomuraea sp. SYSU D8015]